MTLQEYRNYFKSKLKGIYPEEEIASFFYLLTEQFLNLKRVEVALALQQKLIEKERALFDNALQKLEKEVPIQYILGETEFFGLPFKVNPSVLIPRPETEELVAWILEDYSKINQAFTILDIGTGSGCIAISLAKKLPNAKVTALDISAKALQVAKENTHFNKVTLSFIEQDVLELKKLHTAFDVIVSNPPYVRDSEQKLMQNNVLLHEPHQALFVDDTNPLLFYKHIAEIAGKSLNQNGNLYFEINEVFGNEVVEMLQTMGFEEVELKKDVYGKNRMVRATKKA